MIDGYAHLGLPRFWAAADYRSVMRAMGITGALVCPFDSCPDIAECHRAMEEEPEVFRGFGLPLGASPTEVEAMVLAQLEAGFDGVRIGERQLAAQPWALDALGREGGVAMVVGSHGLATVAATLLDFLDRWPTALVIAPHFAGPTDPSVLLKAGPVGTLFAHARFLVVFSRQGIFPEPLIAQWAEALVQTCGWERLMWGSEAPIPFWRDESVAATPRWIERLAPDPAERAGFHDGVARRAVFARTRRPVQPLRLPIDPWRCEVPTPAPMFPFGLSVDTALPGRMVHAWLAAGGEQAGPLSAFVSRLIERGLAAEEA